MTATFTLTGTLDGDTAADRSAYIEYTTEVTNTVDDLAYVAAKRYPVSNGQFSISDLAAWDPLNLPYDADDPQFGVKLTIPGIGVWTFAPPEAGETLDLSSIIDPFPAPTPPSDATVVDNLTATNLGDTGSATRVALNAAIAATIQAMSTVIDARNYADPQAAITACPAGGTVWFDPRTTWTLTTDLTVSKSLAIRGDRTLITQTGTSKAGFTVTSGYVTFDGLDLQGRQSSVLNAAEIGINFTGADTATRLASTVVKNCRIRRWGYAGVFATFIHDFKWTGLTVEDISYMGLGTSSCDTGKLDNIVVDTIVQGTGATNSYGVAFSRNSAVSLATSPVSANIECNNVRVSNVPLWEGFDQHGGTDISFINCQTYNCKVGIAVVPTTVSGVNAASGKNTIIQGCKLDSGRSDGVNTLGISFVGCSTAVGFHNSTDWATGIIANNTFKRFGNEAASSGSAINMQDTLGVVVSGNTFIEPATAAVRLDYNNKDAVLVGNTAVDAWSNTVSIAAMFNTGSTWNTFKVGGNVLTRGAKSATTINAQGLRAGSSVATSILDMGNDFLAATTPWSASDGVVRFDQQGVQGGRVSASPVRGVWQRGAQALSIVPSAGGSPGWSVTTAGGASASTWAVSTAYTAGTWVKTSSGKVLECIIAGTSDASTEPNPSTLGAVLADGTASWIYRAATSAVFKALANVAA